MKLPLAILLYENLIPGSQLINRLQDLGYRVETINDARLLVELAEREKALEKLKQDSGMVLFCGSKE